MDRCFRMGGGAFRAVAAALETLSSSWISVDFRDFSDGSSGNVTVSGLVRLFHGSCDSFSNKTAGGSGTAAVSVLCVSADFLLPSGSSGVRPLGISEDKTVASGWISGTASSYGAGGVAGGVGKPEGGSFHLRLSFLTENLQKYKKNFTTC